MSAVVRLARPSDLPVALPLWEALQHDHEARDPRYRLSDDAPARWAADFREWTRSPLSRVWLAIDGGEAVGLLSAHLYEPAPTYRPMRMVHVTDLYLSPTVRGSGLGRRLVEEARTWGAAEGARQLRAGVLASNPDGRAFWEHLGADDFSVTVTIGIGD